MTNDIEGVDPIGSQRPLDRRSFLQTAAVIGTLTAASSCGNEESPLANTPVPTASGTPAAAPSTTPVLTDITDEDLVTLSLQVAYLQAEYYSQAVLGVPLAAALTTGTGTAGAVSGARPVTIADPVLAEMLREIAFGKIDQVTRLRGLLAGAVTARPAIDIGTGGTGAFTVFAQGANQIVAPATFDVYASQEMFLLGAFVVEDTAVLAYKGHIQSIRSATLLAAMAGLMAASAHHAATVRAQLYVRGAAAGSTLRASTIRLSDWRDQFAPTDDDQGVTGGNVANPGTAANIVPTESDGIISGRQPQLTLNTVYLTRLMSTSGGFFPAGVNGRLRTSATT